MEKPTPYERSQELLIKCNDIKIVAILVQEEIISYLAVNYKTHKEYENEVLNELKK